MMHGSSGISGKRRSDLDEGALIIPEAVGHWLDDFDLVVDSIQEAGVQRPAAMGEGAG
jgi:hypothetical protein